MLNNVRGRLSRSHVVRPHYHRPKTDEAHVPRQGCAESRRHRIVGQPLVPWSHYKRFDVYLVFALHRTANPTYTADELKYQLETIKARMIIAHPSVLPVALDAARAVGLPSDRIILFDPVPGSSYAYLNDLVKLGLDEVQQFTPLRFKPGEAKTKLALLSFSSGTTGRPKVLPPSPFDSHNFSLT